MSSRPSYLLRLIGLALLYAFIAKVVLMFFSANGVVSILWPSSGLALAALLVGGNKYWPGIFIGALVGNVMAGSPVELSIVIATGNTLEALAGVWLLAHINRFNSNLTHPRDFLWLGFAAALSACVAASIGVSALWLTTHLTPQITLQNLLNWWQGDTLGIILFTPLLLVWQKPPYDWFKRERIMETIACFGLAFLAGQIIFLGWFHDIFGITARGYWMFLFVVWGAARFGRHGALLISAITAVQMPLGTILQTEGFANKLVPTGEINFWFYMVALTVTGVTLALIITERKVAETYVLRLTQLYKALTEMNQAIVRMEEQAELFPLACRCAVEFGGMNIAWVGQLEKDGNLITPVASYGKNLDYLDGLVISLSADNPTGLGPASKALRENNSIVINNLLTNPMTAPWREQSAKTGWNSAAAFPIPRGGRPFAVLVVHHEQINAFDNEAITLLEEMSRDITFALDNFDRETQRKTGEESLRLAASVYETSSEAIMITDAENLIIAINPAFTIITGYSEKEALGRNLDILKSGRQDDAFYQAIWSEININGKWQGEIWDRRKNGEVYPKWLTVNTVFNADGSILRRVSLFTDITQKIESENVIRHQANFDPLTELPNRQMFHDRLSQNVKKVHRSDLPLALMFIDLDNFKEVNDTLGHDMGDNLLKEAAQRLTSCVRETDTVARLGGDEFTIILSELNDLKVVDRVAQDALQKLSEPFRLGGEMVYITASIGITFYPQDAAEIETLIKNADQAMYAAKSQGRNRYHYFTPSMQQAAQARMHIANDLRVALAGKQFWIAYQPIVELATGTIHKAEALIRWQHPTRGLISPAEFIPIAEETGLIIDIGDWVFREAAQQVKIWRTSLHPEFQISVNKSPVQFHNLRHTNVAWFEHLHQLGLPGQSITVEITEGLLLDASTIVTERLLEFRDAGMQVSLDDFGTGYSSLSYLKKFDIDYLKIDQSFTRNLALGSDDMALCETIIEMAHKLGLLVIAEGVETPGQRDLLISAGCDYGQGYLFSKPVPAAMFEELFKD